MARSTSFDDWLLNRQARMPGMTWLVSREDVSEARWRKLQVWGVYGDVAIGSLTYAMVVEGTAYEVTGISRVLSMWSLRSMAWKVAVIPVIAFVIGGAALAGHTAAVIRQSHPAVPKSVLMGGGSWGSVV